MGVVQISYNSILALYIDPDYNIIQRKMSKSLHLVITYMCLFAIWGFLVGKSGAVPKPFLHHSCSFIYIFSFISFFHLL